MKRIILIFIFFACSTPNVIKHDYPIIVGNPWDGYLLNSWNIKEKLLDASPNLISVSSYDHQYGSKELFDILKKIEIWMATELPGKKIFIGDLSLKNGGPIARHITHETGRKADIGYIQKSIKTKGHRSHKINNRFTDQFVDKNKISKNFDLESNYKLIAYLISEKVYIAIDQVIIDALKNYNKKAKLINDEQFEKFLWSEPHHKDHFHIGIQCYDFQDRCRNDWEAWDKIGAKKKLWKKEFWYKRETF